MLALGSENGPATGLLGSKMKYICKNVLPHICLAQVLKILYIALPSLPKLIKPSSQGQRWPHVREILCSNHRNAKKYIQQSSSSEQFGPDFLSLVCSFA